METDLELVLNSAMMAMFWMEMDVCGDGYIISQEKWDDGNNISGDGCSSTWTIESFYKWSGCSSLAKDTCIALWGDGFRLISEQCDDKNSVSGDSCSFTWTVDPKYSWSGGSPSNFEICMPICGDALRIGIEQWDDGNIISGDGWSSTWMTELYYICPGGSSTTKDTCSIYCGDGRRARSEQCDDGNIVSGDDNYDGQGEINYKDGKKYIGTYCGYLEFDGERYWDAWDTIKFEVKPSDRLWLPSDSRYRVDFVSQISGEIEEAQKNKEKLEIDQRNDAMLRGHH